MTTDTPKLPPVIGITGAAGSGKTTAANWIVRNHNQAARMAFARPLKKMIYELIRDATPKTWPVKPTEYIENPELKETPIPFLGGYTARRLMQTLGTEWGRNAVHEDFWVVIAAGKLERLLGSSFKNSETVPIKAVFDDVRFENEATMIRAYGGTVIRVIRPDATKPADIAGHASEAMAFEADITLVNDGTQADLEAELADLFPVPEKKA